MRPTGPSPPAISATHVAALALGLALAAGSAPAHADDDLGRFFGAYVGTADVADLKSGEREQRDMDIVIEPYEEDGFRLRWVNVTLVDGKRTLPGVERHVQSVLFEPAEGRDLYVEVEEGSLFREREERNPMKGDPVRWAAIDGDRMHVYSFLVLEDGRYEMQIYDRVLTDIGIDIDFQRVVDGEVLKTITGTTARAEPGGEEDEE